MTTDFLNRFLRLPSGAIRTGFLTKASKRSRPGNGGDATRCVLWNFPQPLTLESVCSLDVSLDDKTARQEAAYPTCLSELHLQRTCPSPCTSLLLELEKGSIVATVPPVTFNASKFHALTPAKDKEVVLKVAVLGH